MSARALLPQNWQGIGRMAATGGSGSWKPSLLTMLALAAAASAVANAVASTTPPTAAPDAPTRLGTAIGQNLRDRDQAMADQRRALELREQAQRAAEHRLQNDLQANQGAASPSSSPTPNPADSANGMYDSLARIYQTMKPTKAAPIFEKLDPEVQLQVAKRMRDRSAALLLAAMSPDAAAELSMALAGRHVVKAPPAQPVGLARLDAAAPSSRHREPREPREAGNGGEPGRKATRARTAPPRETARQDQQVADAPVVAVASQRPAGPAAGPVLAAK